MQDSYKLLHPTYDDHNRPYATYTRGTLAKRPVNIRNVQVTGTTSAGNFLNRYEYVNIAGAEANDAFFVKNVDQFTQTTLRYPAASHTGLEANNGPMGASIQNILAAPPGTERSNLSYSDLTLLDRTFLTGTVRNRTRIKTRFSSPGGFETLSRGFLDPAHETYSPNNAMTFRNA